MAPLGSQRLVPHANADSVQGECWPENAETLIPGATRAKGKGEARFNSSEHEILNVEQFPGTGGGTLEFAFSAEIGNDGTAKGGLSAKIKWDNKNLPKMTFESGCIAEVETEVNIDSSVGKFEAEYEGGVTDFPGYTGTTKAAVASIAVTPDGDKATVRFSIELGYTCNEGFPGGTTVEIEITGISVTDLKVKKFEIDNVNAIRVNFPPTYSSSNCPGFF
jgi:hypothetical protein